MNSTALVRKAEKIADNFLDAELENDTEAKAWLVEKIVAALEEVADAAREAGYNEAVAKRF
jgi:hypothetical protein